MREDGSDTASRTRLRDLGFTTTHWSVVIQARGGGTPRSAAALETLLKAYWYPIYAYVRRCGNSPQDAEDLTQSFLARLVARQDIQNVTREKGRFRSFLLVALNNFMANEWDRSQAQKRGGQLRMVSFEREEAERWYEAEMATQVTPETLYEQRWACALLDRVMTRLGESYAEKGEAQLFEALKSTLLDDPEAAPYAEIAARFGVSEASLKMRVQRLRLRYQQLLREEIAATVAHPEYIEDEINHLQSVLSG